MSDMEQLPDSFFARDTRLVARALLGCWIVSEKDSVATGGRIVETEAYLGSADAGSHASTKGVTDRNRVMFGPPAHAYVYFTYGCHHMLNLVTETDGEAGAVLIRASDPQIGMDVMRKRRGVRPDRELTNGPGKLALALGLNLSDNASRLGGGLISVFKGTLEDEECVGVSGRVGLSSGFELPFRFFIQGHEFVSKGRTGPPPTRRRPGGPR